MSNPRRFDGAVYHRITNKLSLDEAKRVAAKERYFFNNARVDTYKGGYAVWSDAPQREKLKGTKKMRLFHGTSSDILRLLSRRKYIFGWYTSEYRHGTPQGDCVAFASVRYHENPHKSNIPVILEVFAPANLFERSENEKDWYIPIKIIHGSPALDKGYLVAVWWYIGEHELFEWSTIGRKSEWERRKL